MHRQKTPPELEQEKLKPPDSIVSNNTPDTNATFKVGRDGVSASAKSPDPNYVLKIFITLGCFTVLGLCISDHESLGYIFGVAAVVIVILTIVVICPKQVERFFEHLVERFISRYESGANAVEPSKDRSAQIKVREGVLLDGNSQLGNDEEMESGSGLSS